MMRHKSAGGLFLAVLTILCAAALPSSALAADLEGLLSPAQGKALFVSEKGENKNDGSKEKPFRNIDKAIKSAADGDTILVAEGSYTGTFGIGYFECDKAVKLYGGFNADFSARDPAKHPSLIQPDNQSGAKARKALLKFTKKIDGVVVDGFVFDLGQRNSYSPSEGKPAGVETGMLLLPPEKASGQVPTVTEPCLSIPSSAPEGSVEIRNNVFANCPNFGIQAAQRGGTFTVSNNVFVANRMAAVEIYGTCRPKPGAEEKCGTAEISHNTVLFTWSRLKDFQDMGYGVRVMTKLEYNIHHNVIGTAILAGVDHTRFNKNEWIKIDNNVFFVNKAADLKYSPASNTDLELFANQFGDLEIASASGNRTEIPGAIPVDKAYLEGFLSARYSEKADFDRSSPANQFRSALGMNMQGKLTTAVSMFGNRYPWKQALSLFGAVKDAGAQAIP